MSLLQNPKVRAAALLLAGAVSIQVWPSAYGQEHRATIVKDAEAKAPKKSGKSGKKRSTGHVAEAVKQSSPWRIAPVAAQLAPSDGAKAKVDPIKRLLQVAYKQLGKPYRYGAAGPDRFDCSGFTQYVYRKALGHTLPRTSGSQRAGTKSVPLGKLKPGDLVFSSGHVGLYVGKGKMIHSPQTGRTVSVDPIHGNTYGAGRPLA